MNLAVDLARDGEAPRSSTHGKWRVLVSASLETFADLWPRAARPSDAIFHVFQSAEFLQVWLDTIGRARSVTPCFCAVLDIGGEPLMLLPLGIEERGGTRVLTFLDGGASDYNAPVLFRRTPAWDANQALEILQAIFAALPAFDVVLFEKMPASVLGRPNPLLHLPTQRWPCDGHAAVLSQSWEAYASGHIRHSRRFAGHVRHLMRSAPLTYAVADAETWQAWLEKLFAQKEARFVETRVPGFSEQPGMHEFYREATRRLLGEGLVHLSALKASGEVIAIQWGLRQGDRHYYLISGFEGGNWRKFSPGRLLMEAMLKWCHANGILLLDFGIGDEDYKYKYCDDHLALFGTLKPVTLRGRAYAARVRALAWLRATRVWQALRPYKWVVLRRLKGGSADAA